MKKLTDAFAFLSIILWENPGAGFYRTGFFRSYSVRFYKLSNPVPGRAAKKIWKTYREVNCLHADSKEFNGGRGLAS
jgi:hypothetical protein